MKIEKEKRPLFKTDLRDVAIKRWISEKDKNSI